MAAAPSRRPGLALAVLTVALALVLTSPTIPAGAAPAPQDAAGVAAGPEGSRAALVRIQVTAITTIVHLDHSTGDLHVIDGRYEIRQGQATGVVVSGDGVVATLYRELAVDVDRVVVPAANRLFVDRFGATLEAGQQATGRTRATEPHLDTHLQDCYVQRTDHCFTVPQMQYDVVLLTDPPRRVRALLVNDPQAPTDVALLRIGGASMPTAPLAAAGDVPAGGELVGYDADVPSDPAEQGGWRPVSLPVTVDGAALSGEGLPEALDRGLTGGPVIDPSTGEVLALADLDRAGAQAGVVGADAVRAAVDAAGIEGGSSPFDVAFRSGLTLLEDGDAAAAVRQLELAGRYFDSALVAEHTRAAVAAADAAPEQPVAPGDGGVGVWPWLVGGAALLLAAAAWLFRAGRRRRRDQAPPPGSPPVLPDRTGPPTSPPSVPGPPGPAAPAGHSARHAAGVVPAAPAATDTRVRASALLQRPPERPSVSPDAYCVHCGHARVPDGRFCGRCGSPVGA
ncbi:zinc ribbon domain-containing protein [Geodermatophilus sp. SYSU D01106]